jgi:hypothetical protein
MTDTRVCGSLGCKRAPAFPGQRFCETHRLRWTPQATVPEWVRRAQAHRLPAKIRSAA